ncbi:MaoC/PaaZ C-terminal domain-containing protein [Sphingopyxis sp. GW247-27LB]|uniref:MaoC/PaaZ C-terminal domain-containing protein n=1 Tax=Sphingopyxis sp. GW247-27LB TaxID=2012632 RepID=UPI000BA5464A|nr:MaoC/PaaZ C-terminal domain-containing protein [Sphingopyxis sp. GW247-27LB]PAL24207.1 3-alpha,7-alpha,12-alpha-trihydroxy-5-beta-cholest-24-enoyl-CoA hydratase [Sphingopyxis sp. GW247-27LB]
MVIAYEDILQLTDTCQYSWTERDVITYALGIGMPGDPLDMRQLPYVYEAALRVLPTFAVTLGFNHGAMRGVGIDYRHVLHGEHAVTVHKPIPLSGSVSGTSKIVGAWDKGVGKGAVFRQEMVLMLDGDATPMATVTTTSFGRAEGGFGGPTSGQPAPHAIPDRRPDRSIELPTLRNQALLYRQAGDANPLHVDPVAAQAAGFPQPILHGLCTYAFCQRAILEAYCDFDADRLMHHEVRFSAPAFPGETILVDMWRDGPIISFEARIRERDVTVIRNGKAIIS